MSKGRARAGRQIALGWFFLRAGPVRAAGVIAGVVAGILMVSLLVLQSMDLSGEQEAAISIGASDYALTTGSSVQLGSSGSEVDNALLQAVLSAGGSSPRVRYDVLDGLTLEAQEPRDVVLEEAEWATEPFPERFALEAGRWPAADSEAAVSSAVADAFPVGSDVTLFGGAWTGTIVGVVGTDFDRSAATLFVSAGMWNSLAALGPEVADRYGSSASRTLSWSGGDTTVVLAAVGDVLADVPGAAPPEFLGEQLMSRDELISRGSSELIEFRISSLAAPFLGAFVGALLAMRFVNRIRAVMLAVGVGRSKTRSSGLIAVALSITLGLCVGAGVGIAAGFALRPLIDQMSARALGPVHDVGVMFAGIVTASLVGAVGGVTLNAARQTVGTRERVSRGRVPARYVVLPILGIAFLTVGHLAAQAARSVDQIILAGICFAAGGVIIVPLVLELILLREPRRLPALLAARRLRSDTRQTGWITTAVAGLLVVGFATTTLLTSAITTTNESNASTVPPGQIHLTLPDTAADTLAAEVSEYLGMEPVTFANASGGVTLLDGATVVVGDIPDLEALTGVELTPQQQELLESGGTVRTKTPEITEVTLEVTGGGAFTLPAETNEALTRDYGRLDGFILRSTADRYGIPLVTETKAYLNPTAEQSTLAEGAANALGFNADWIAVNTAPDVFDEPAEARLAAAVISLLAIAVLVYFVTSAARMLRPNLSTLRAIGARRRWLTEVLVLQTATVLVVAVGSAALAATSGMFAAIVVSGLGIQLIAPWQSVGITVGVLAAGAAAAMSIASRRLTNDDRFAGT